MSARDLLARVVDVLGDRACLVGGTLLGCVRDGRLIEGDADVDVAMHLEDWHEDLVRALGQRGVDVLRARRWGRGRSTLAWARRYVGDQVYGQPSALKVARGDWEADIYVMAPGVGVHAARRWVDRAGRVLVWRPAALVADSVPAMVEGLRVRIPARAEELLAHFYGPDWRIPVPGPWQGTPGWHLYAKARWVRPDTPVTVYTAGVFDLFHRGHARFIERAAALGDLLIVGVLANTAKASESAEVRLRNVRNEVPEARIDGPLTEALLDEVRPNVLAYGPEWNRPEARVWAERRGTTIVTLPRTPGISSTQLREAVSAAR